MNEKVLLMEIQYNLPLTEQPFVDLAENLGLNPNQVIEKLKELRAKGVIKRIGANVNYKSIGIINKAALVAFACRDEDVYRIAKIINESFDKLSLKHNFWREHKKYKIWFAFKGKNRDEMFRKVKELAEKCNVKDFLFLPSKRVYKMDVKYDLFKGISWSEKGVEKENVPLVEEMDLSVEMVLELEKLKIVERPFKEIAIKYGYKEDELVDLVHELIKKGVIRDFCGVLKESKIGFIENGMNIVKVDNAEKLALKLVQKYPQITHLVEREVPENWNYTLYFMIHANSRDKIEKIRDEISQKYDVEILTLYSKRDLLSIL